MTDEMVAAQLEALRALGILRSDGEEEEEMYDEDEDEDQGGGETSGRVLLLPLPPAPSHWTRPFPLPDRLERWALDSSGRCSEKKRAVGSSNGRRSCSTSGGSLRSSSRPSEILQRPRSRRPAARLSPPRCLDPTTIDCFDSWKRYTVEHQRSTGLKQLADACLKKRGINRWSGFLHWQKYEHERAERLNQWRAARACKLWRAWMSRRRRVLTLLRLEGRSLANRSRKQRVWRRWRHFTRKEKLSRLRIITQRSRSDSRRLRDAWNELVAHAFKSMQARQLVLRCFKRLIRYRHQQMERLRELETYRLALEGAKLRRIAKTWRMFAYSSGYDRRCVCRVRFGVVRKRFFALWRQVYRTRVRTAELRSRVQRQRLGDHFRAWQAVNQALLLSSQITSARGTRHMWTVFKHWVREAALQRSFKSAEAAVEAMRLSRAISSLMELTALSRKRLGLIRELRAAHEQRLVKFAWTKGWLRFHKTQANQRRLQSCITDALMRWTFRHWLAFHHTQSTRRLKYLAASSLRRVQSCRTRWRDWKAFVDMRREHKSALDQAARHRAHRLLRVGVLQWWGTVRTHDQDARRTLAIRQNQRNRLKKRCFSSWEGWTRSKQQRAALVDRLKRSPSYPLSVCNPARRAWRRWGVFVAQTKRDNRGRLYCRERLQRKALRAWRRHALLASQLRTLQLQRIDAVCHQAFIGWKFRLDQRPRKAANILTAMHFHKRKSSHRAFGCWAKLTAEYLRRVRVCRERLERQHNLQLQTRMLRAWMTEFRSRQHLSNAVRHRQSHILQRVVGCWHRFASKQTSLRRKLEYFHNIYGKYPRSSVVHRLWHVWRLGTRQASILRSFTQRQRQRATLTCWTAWSSFVRYRCMFRAWRSMILASGVHSPSFKVRHCRKKRRRHLKTSVIQRWKQLIVHRRHRVEHFSRLRLQVYSELQDRLAALQAANVWSARRWFSRWRFSENRTSVRCMRTYQVKLLRKVLQGWWRLSIHTRQEQVLHDAKRIIGTMSYYQEPISTHAMVSSRQEQSAPRKEVTRRTARHSREARRLMVDPLGPVKYSALSGQGKKTKASGDEDTARPSNCSVVFPMTKMKRLPSDLNAATRESIDRKCKHTRSSRGNENISLVNVVTLPSDRQDKPYRSAAPSLKPVERQIPDSRAPLDGLSRDAPAHTRRVDSRNGQLSRASTSSSRRSEHACAVLDTSEVERRKAHAEAGFGSAINELPLFDKDCEPHEQHQPPVLAIKSVVMEDAKHVAPKSPSPPRPTSITTVNAGATPPMTLESLAHLDVYGDLPHLATATTDSISRETPRQTTPMVPSEVCQESTANDPDDQHYKRPIVELKQSARSPIRRVLVDPKSTEKRPLSDILGLSSTKSRLQVNTQSAPATTTDSRSADVPQRSLDDIISYYAQQLHPSSESKSLADPQTTAQLPWRVCFELVRDLRLLRNDFYICELENVFRAVYFTPIDGDATQSPAELAASLARTREQLKLFLHEAISAHPAYIDAVKTSRASSTSTGHSIFEPLSSVDERQYPSLPWLTGVYLPSFLSQEAPPTAASTSAQYWISRSMPQNMKRALDKFVPVINKYTDILGQFFARGAGAFQHPSVGTIDPRHYRMTRPTFFTLMRQARVFPQLFHRRELEQAFSMSTLTYRSEDAVNFPEFVELLARCSASLQWGSSSRLDKSEKTSRDLQTGAEAETTSVVKFLMLIFAMEGKGSVLRKRSKDLDVVIEFLSHQQQQSREHKMKRFKLLLAEQETVRRAQRKEKSRQATSPVTKVLSLLSACKRAEVRSPSVVTPPSPARTFDDLTHSWDFENQESMLSGVHDQEAGGSRGSTQASAGAAGEGRGVAGPNELPREPPAVHFGSVESGASRAIVPGKSSRVTTDTQPLTDPRAGSIVAGRSVGDSLCEGEECLKTGSTYGDGLDTNTNASAQHLDVGPQLRAPGSLLDARHDLGKNEFLDDILTSIGDVELLLGQSSRLPERRRLAKPGLLDDTQPDRWDLDHVSHSQPNVLVGTEEIAPQASTVFIDQANATSMSADSSFSYITSDLRELAAHCGDDDVQVKDAMLDYLTDAARFSDRSDRQGDVFSSSRALADSFPFDSC